jgi:hypothetical protein
MARRKVNMDPAVAAVMGDTKRRERRRGMTKAQKRQAERDAQRQRVTLELDPRIVAMVREIAEAEGCSPASVINLFVADALQRYVDGELVFVGHRRPSEGPRYDWVVIPPAVGLVSARLGDVLEG